MGDSPRAGGRRGSGAKGGQVRQLRQVYQPGQSAPKGVPALKLKRRNKGFQTNMAFGMSSASYVPEECPRRPSSGLTPAREHHLSFSCIVYQAHSTRGCTPTKHLQALPPPPLTPARPPQVAQELTFMGIWLRIPLVHPEAMDVDADICDKKASDSSVEAKSDGEVVESNGKASSTGEEGTLASVEDPWETWNAIRVLCEHKSW